MKRTLLICFCFLRCMAVMAQEEERYFAVELGPVGESDTLRRGWIDTRAKDARKGIELVRKYADLLQQREAYQAVQQESSGELERKLKENDAFWESYRENLKVLILQPGLGAQEKKALQQQLDGIDKEKEKARRELLAQMKGQAAAGREALKGVNPSSFSDAKLLALKKDISKYLLGKQLWNFSKARDFCNGFAAVACSGADGKERWGFVNRQGRLVIPCEWDDVSDFGGDDRLWTSVRSGDLGGMIDTTGIVRIPVIFAARSPFVFRKTAQGELADAKDPGTLKWGLIDRSGNWAVSPSCPELWWDPEKSFYWYENERGKAIVVKP